MRPQTNSSPHLNLKKSRTIVRSLLLLALLALSGGTLAAQTEQETKQAAARQLLNEGVKLSEGHSKESLEQAIQKLQQARPIFHSINDITDEATTLLYLGKIFKELGETQKALDSYKEARSLFRAVGSGRGEAIALLSTSLIYEATGEMQKALDLLNLVLPLYRAAGNRGAEAAVLISLGRVYDTLGDKQSAVTSFNQSLPLLGSVGDSKGQADVFIKIALLYSTLGEKRKALASFKDALLLWRSLGDRTREADTLLVIGKVHDDLNEPQEALNFYSQALPLFRAVGHKRGEAITTNKIGLIYYDLGETQKALDYLNQSLPLLNAVGDKKTEANTLNKIGLIYVDLGDPLKAFHLHDRAMDIYRAIGDKEGQATTLNNIGNLYNLVSKQKALGFYLESLPILRAAGDKWGEALILSNVGRVYHDMGETQKAFDSFNESLRLIRTVGDKRYEAVTLTNLGGLHHTLGEMQKALDFYNQAVTLFRVVGDKRYEADVLGNIAGLERDRGNLREARVNVKAAIDIVETMRGKLVNQELRSCYFACMHGYYEFYIDVAMRLHERHPGEGYDGEALQVSERARARSLLELLNEAGTDIRQDADPTLVERERVVREQLNVSAQRQVGLLSGPHTKAQADAIAKEIESRTTELQQVQTQIRQTSPRYAALTQPQPLTLREIQTQVLDADTLILEYSLGEERSYLWAVTPTSIASYTLPKREEIEAAARQVYGLLNARNERIKGETRAQRVGRVAQADKDIPTAAARLSQMIFAPVAARLGKKRLVIVADGMLHYIPFAVLPAPSVNASALQPLIIEHEIVSLPSASTLAVLRREVAGRKPAPQTVVALADPVFMKNDERVRGALSKPNGDEKSAPPTKPTPLTKALPPAGTETVRELELVEAIEDASMPGGGFFVSRLLGSRKEAQEIVAMVPASERKLVLDFEANRRVATSAELSRYRYVHFSTHGFLNSVHPELSGIVFSLVNERGEAQDGFLRAHEVFNLKLPAEVVVLSACQTGIGKEVKGEGLVSLTRGFMYAGTPRVVVSLWSVNEIGTAELMVTFYKEMLKEGKTPAAALRAAQISLMKEQKWRSPFYWAGFTLQGEWR